MKIIGKNLSRNKDYYDGVANTLGVDNSVIYYRNQSIINDDKFKKVFMNYIEQLRSITPHSIGNNITDCVGYSFFIIGFCGRLYTGWKFYYSQYDKSSFLRKTLCEITYDSQEVMLKFKMNKVYQAKFTEIINEIHNKDLNYIFINQNTPIFVFEKGFDGNAYLGFKNNTTDGNLIINPILNDYEFYKMIDSYQTFQEISMYLSNILTNNPEIIEIDDKYKIVQHGFDNKWSFRKEPEIKKLK